MRVRHSFAADEAGIALVEFALTFPLLLLLFTGAFQISDALSVYRKVTTTSRTVADLTTQYTIVSDGDLDKVLNASQQVMWPYTTAAASLRVTQVKIDANKVATVDWSRSKNGTAFAKGDTVDIPMAIRQANTSLVVASVAYSYVPTFGGTFIGTIPMAETIIMSPRASSSIVHS